MAGLVGIGDGSARRGDSGFQRVGLLIGNCFCASHVLSAAREIASLLFGMPLSLQRHAAGKLNAIYHFVFNGNEATEATVMIRDGKLSVENGLRGVPNIKVIADSETWLGFLAGERNLLWALLTRRVRLRGNPKWLLALKRCFP